VRLRPLIFLLRHECSLLLELKNYAFKISCATEAGTGA
jgi:hypothetical protein